MYDFKPFQWECEKTISASNLRYRIRLEDHVLTDASGSPEATMFTFSYLQKKGGQNREQRALPQAARPERKSELHI